MGAQSFRVDPLPSRPPTLSLFRSAVEITGDSIEWGLGFEFNPERCTGGGIGATCGGISKVVDLADNPENVHVDPFVVWAGVTCGTFDNEGINRLNEERAFRLLAACESRLAAREFWLGELTQTNPDVNNFYLAQPGSIVVTDAAGVEPHQALACLEQGLGECACGGDGMIHASRQVATYLFDRQLLERSGNQVQTKLGTTVVVDDGYTGTSPDGLPDVSGVAWMYASSRVGIRKTGAKRANGTLADSIDELNNTQIVIVERVVGLSVDECCHLAAAVAVEPCTGLVFGS